MNIDYRVILTLAALVASGCNSTASAGTPAPVASVATGTATINADEYVIEYVCDEVLALTNTINDAPEWASPE